jgi:hypothetical protein
MYPGRTFFAADAPRPTASERLSLPATSNWHVGSCFDLISAETALKSLISDVHMRFFGEFRCFRPNLGSNRVQTGVAPMQRWEEGEFEGKRGSFPSIRLRFVRSRRIRSGSSFDWRAGGESRASESDTERIGLGDARVPSPRPYLGPPLPPLFFPTGVVGVGSSENAGGMAWPRTWSGRRAGIRRRRAVRPIVPQRRGRGVRPAGSTSVRRGEPADPRRVLTRSVDDPVEPPGPVAGELSGNSCGISPGRADRVLRRPA